MSARLITFLLLVAAVGIWTASLRGRQAREQASDFGRIPVVLGARIGLDDTYDAATLRALRADRVLSRTYRDPAGDATRVHLFVAYFGSQETGSQIHSPQHCLPGGGWRILTRDTWAAPTPAGPRPVNEFVIAKGAGKQLVYYWFVTRSGILSNEFKLKWDLVRNSLLGLPTDAAFIRLVRPVGPDGLDAARGDLRRFCAQILPILDEAVPIAPRSGHVASAN